MRTQLAQRKGDAKKLRGLFRNWQARQTFVLERVAFLAASFVRDEAVSKLSADPRYAAYMKSLRLVEIPAYGGKARGFGVHAYARKRTHSKREQPYVLLYVRPRRKVPITDPSVPILARFSPWTWETLPKIPPKAQAVVVAREVSQREAELWTERRNKSKRAWQQAFVQAGISTHTPRPPTESAEAEEDVAFQALRLELGTGGSAWIPHWRPALRALRLQKLRDFLKDPLIARAISDPAFNPSQHSPRAAPIHGAALQQIADFQVALGY